MGRYSIKELEQLSGIKAHTIRIWEQRYRLLTPKRTDTNIRYYDDKQLKILLNAVTLLDNGHKISRIAGYSDEQINAIIDELLNASEPTEHQARAIINQMVSAALNYDELVFDKTFSNALLRYSLKEMYEAIIYPILVKIGLMWNKDDLIPSQEHFLSNLFKQKLFAALDSTPSSINPKGTWLLFLPEKESHEIGLLISAVMLRLKGYRVIYLGQNVPYLNIREVIKDTKPDFMYFFVVTHQPLAELQVYINLIAEDNKEVNIKISARENLISQLSLPSNMQRIHSLNDLVSNS